MASTKPNNHWSLGLKQTIKDPKNIVMESQSCFVINDKYPKAKVHFLVLPKKDEIPNIKALTSSNISLLQHMIDLGKDVINLKQKDNKNMVFKMGFHAIPSMTLLHMHVISTDFDSICLKTKRHWNSFTSPFFIPADSILSELKENLL